MNRLFSIVAIDVLVFSIESENSSYGICCFCCNYNTYLSIVLYIIKTSNLAFTCL